MAHFVEKHCSSNHRDTHRVCSGPGWSRALEWNPWSNRRRRDFPDHIRRKLEISFPPNRDRMKIFLTGSSSGIGLAIANALTARGDEVWGTSRNIERISPSPRLHPVALDLSDSNSIAEAFNKALAEAG